MFIFLLRMKPYLLLTLPRCGGTVVELIFANQGEVELSNVICNPFDINYYFVLGRGESPPQQDLHSTEGHTFKEVADQLQLFAQSEPQNLLVRAAAYTLMPLDANAEYLGFLSYFNVVFVTADPRQTLRSHQRKLDETGEQLCLEEAGFHAQLEVAKYLRSKGIGFFVLSYDEMLQGAEAALQAAGLKDIDPTVTWTPGMRQRWCLWAEGSWKKNASESTSFCPRVSARANGTLASGNPHPFEESCLRVYRELMSYR